jgi:hypothetical protein
MTAMNPSRDKDRCGVSVTRQVFEAAASMVDRS